MPELSNRERISRGLDVLAAGLDEFISRAVHDELGAQKDWTTLLASFDSSKGNKKWKYNRLDPQCSLRMLTENVTGNAKRGWYPFDQFLSRGDKAFASELRDVRNRVSHDSSPISVRDTIRALDTMERLLAAADQHEEAGQIAAFLASLTDAQQEPTKVEKSRQPVPTNAAEAPAIAPPLDREAALRNLADAGNAKAQNAFGNMLRGDRGRRSEAEGYFRQSANSGHVQAMFNLGNLLQGQPGTRGEAEDWYRKAAQTGHVAAMYSLGRLLRSDERRVSEAESWYRKAAAGGCVNAMVFLAYMYRDRREKPESEFWFRKACDAGDIAAIYEVGQLLRTTERITWFRNSAEAGHVEAMYRVAQLLRAPSERLEAESWYSKAAAAGHVGSMEALGRMLRWEAGRERDAESWFRKAAGAGSVTASNALGLMLLERRDLPGAERLFRKASENGYAEPMNNLGKMLRNCAGRRQDSEGWYYQAAMRGHKEAMNTTALVMIERGDLSNAEELLRKAVNVGNVAAMNNLGDLLLKNPQRLRDAEDVYARAARRGNPDAMISVAALLERRGCKDEAARWVNESNRVRGI